MVPARPGSGLVGSAEGGSRPVGHHLVESAADSKYQSSASYRMPSYGLGSPTNLSPLEELKLPSIGYVRPAPGQRSGGAEPTSIDKSPRHTAFDPMARSGNFSSTIGSHVHEDYGVRHKGKVIAVRHESTGLATALGGSLRKAGTSADVSELLDFQQAWLPCLDSAMLDFEDQNEKALKAMSEYLGKLPKGTPVIEIASRSGDFAVALANKFPDLYIQPTEGLGETSQALFAVLEERVRLETTGKFPGGTKAGHKIVASASDTPVQTAGSRNAIASKAVKTGGLLQPRQFDARLESSYTTSLAKPLGAVLALHALQYVSRKTVYDILAGSKRALRNGGYLLLCGAFFEGGEVSYKSMLYHASLQHFEQQLMEKDRQRRPEWGLKDANWIRDMGAELGLDFVALKRIGINDPDDCLLLVMRKHLQNDRENVKRGAVATSELTDLRLDSIRH